MKRIYLSIVAATLLFTACNEAPTGEKAEVSEVNTTEEVATPEGDPYQIIEGSTIAFLGATPSHTQNGSFNISNGAIYMKENAITGGNVTVNLADMEVTTAGLDDKKKGELKGHLMGADFFNADKNPDVKFNVTEVAVLEGDANNTHTITGNLAMNGKTNSISFPAKVDLADTKMGINANFVINRKDWGMVYGADESLGDKWIYDDVKMTLSLNAMK